MVGANPNKTCARTMLTKVNNNNINANAAVGSRAKAPGSGW